MFSGIVETIGRVVNIVADGSNIHFTIQSSFTEELKIDQSIAHNGVCLTVVAILGAEYQVTAIEETLNRSNLGELKIGDEVNLERCLKLTDRLDGHMVQGHVDKMAQCAQVEDLDGSWKFTFTYAPDPQHITVPKGSICVNGVSLTVVDSERDSFSVCIIPYTFDHTNFKNIKRGDVVNLEFDIIGKYVMRYLAIQNN